MRAGVGLRLGWLAAPYALVAGAGALCGSGVLMASGGRGFLYSAATSTSVGVHAEHPQWPRLLPVVVPPDHPFVFQFQWDSVDDVNAVVGRVDGDQLVGVVSVTVGSETVGPAPTPVTSVFGQPASVTNWAGRDGIIVTLAGAPRVTIAGIDDDVWAFLAAASPEFVDRTLPIEDEVPLGALPAGYSVITNGPDVIAGSISVELGHAGPDPQNAEGPYIHTVVSTTPCVGLGRRLTTVDINGHRGWLTEGYVDVWGGDATSDWVCWQLATGTFVFVTGNDVEDLLERARALTFIPSDEWFDRYADQLDTPPPPP